MARKILLLLIVGFAMASSSLMAIGLGEIKLKSGLNQPLNAEITILFTRGESNDQLKGKLGSTQGFDRAGMDRTYFLTRIKFKVITKANGVKVLQLTTKDAVKEPFLNFLVDLEWPNGKLLREYTLLLDPPIFDDAPKTIVTPVAKSSPTPKATEQVRTPRRTVTPKPEWQGELYGPTSGSDTLWGIAAKVRPSGVSIQQAMITIFEKNPKAFMRGNINNLKRGAEIRVPESQVFNQVTQREALRMIAAHNDNWKTGKRTSPRVVMDTSSNNDSARGTTQNTSEGSGRLQLGTDSDESGAGGSRASDALIEEENVVLKQQNDSLTEQSKSSADRIERLERLLELKDEQLAKIQNRDKTQELQQQDLTANSAQASTTQDNNETKPQNEDFTPTPVAIKESKGLIDNIIDGTYNLYLGIAGGIVFLLLMISIFRRRNEDVDYHDAVAASKSTNEHGGVKLTPTLADTADDLPEIADDVLAGTEVNDFDDEEVIETDETSDPLGEADIYLAYGKYEQAESLLISAIENNPERLELNCKLLECYAEMNEQAKFEQHISSIYNEIESDGELRSFIEEIYLTTWPEGTAFVTESDDSQQVDDEFSFEQDAEDPTPEDSNPEDEFVIDDDDLDSNEIDVDDINDADINDMEELPSTEDVFGDSEDVTEPEESEEDRSEEVNTQLDLARAYVEMGDFDGTREIIKEMFEIGSEQQCEEAQAILDGLDD